MSKAMFRIMMIGVLFSSLAKADLDDFDDPNRGRRKNLGTEGDKPEAEPDLGNAQPKEEPPLVPAAKSSGQPVPPKTPGGAAAPTPAAPAPSGGALGAQKAMRPGESHNNSAPINWKAHGFKGTRAGRLIELNRDVEVTQDKMTFTSDRAEIYFNEKDEVNKVNAIGKVKIVKTALLPQDRVTARGDEATFYNTERKLIMRGMKSTPKRKAMLSRGGDVVSGKEISYDLDTGWITVDSVEGIVQPGEQPKP